MRPVFSYNHRTWYHRGDYHLGSQHRVAIIVQHQDFLVLVHRKKTFFKIFKVPGNKAHNSLRYKNFKNAFNEEVKTTIVNSNNKILEL
jgi:hypothetical protein